MSNLTIYWRLNKDRGFWTFLAVLLLGIVLLPSSMLAQSGAGSIQGTVTDSTGAVIAGASIHVVNPATSIGADARSNEVGFYQVPGLFAGSYVITITSPRMKTYKTSLQLLVAQNAIINAAMTAGDVTQEVEVSAAMVQLTSNDNGTITSTIENARINELPMNGRSLLTLAGATTPGLEANGQRANGLMYEAMEYVQDGAPLTDRNFGGARNTGTAQLPDPDAVQEVRLETTNTSAQFAAPGTAIITTKSGTNQLHGSAFETARNNAIGIGRDRSNGSSYSAPHLVRNEFGASAGGPIILPHVYHGKDKSFWFFAYERYSLAQTIFQNNTVPMSEWKSGNFTSLANSSGAIKLYDPSTTDANNNYARTQFAYGGVANMIDPARMAPASKILYAISPTPTTDENPLITTNYVAKNPTYTVIPAVTFRLDHSFNETNKAYLRYTDSLQKNQALRNQPWSVPATVAATTTADINGSSTSVAMPDKAEGYQLQPQAVFSGSLGYTHIFSPSFFSETVLSQEWGNLNVLGGGSPNKNYESMLGLPNNFGETGFPYIGASSVGSTSTSSIAMVYDGTMWNYQEAQIITNLDENLTLTRGKHQMQFGGRYRHERIGYEPDRSSDVISFSSLTTGLYDTTSGANYTAVNKTGDGNGDFYLGSASSYYIKLNAPYIHFHDMEYDAYFQDNYHPTRNVTLNLGLRWEAHPATWVKDNLLTSFDMKNNAVIMQKPLSWYVAKGYTTQAIATNMTNLGVNFETPAAAGYPDSLLRNYNLNFAPRIGIAYQPFNGKYGTVIRGAYGRYLYAVPVRNTIKNTVQNVPYQGSYNHDYTDAAQSSDSKLNYLIRTSDPVVMGKNSANVIDSTSTSSILPGINFWGLSPAQAPDFVTQVNFTIEQPLKGNSALRVSWLFTHASNLDHAYYFNYHPSTYVWEMQTGTAVPTGTTIGSSTYATTGTGPYDKTKWGGSSLWDAKDGWSNYNGLQINYQRLYHHGYAYQIGYTWSKTFRVGGNWTRDSQVYPTQDYQGTDGALGTMSTVSGSGTVTAPTLPPGRPSGLASYANFHNLARYEDYMVETGLPFHHIVFNGLVDIPVGRGKKFLGNAPKWLDEIVGGFQLASNGSIVTQAFMPSSSNWGATNPIKTYKHNAPITDCTSGVCRRKYLWFNGYMAPGLINASSKGYYNLPSDYAAYQSPIVTDTSSSYYNTNNVYVTLANGTKGVVAYSPGPTGANVYSHKVINGPINWTDDMSIFKVFKVTDSKTLRVNVDAFNAFNVQGYVNPDTTTGIESVQSSYWSPRQIQITARFTF